MFSRFGLRSGRPISELLADFRRGLHSGRRFSKLVRDRGRMFPNMYSSIVEAGEESGALPQVLAQLRHFLLMMREMKSFMISGMNQLQRNFIRSHEIIRQFQDAWY